MKQRCLACGVEKDTSVKEVYPYGNDDGITDEPIEPFFRLDCQSGFGLPAAEWRVVTVCHECFHKLQPDLWINNIGWQSLNPITPFEQLPKLEDN
jgi:hypothetical protein